MTQKILEVLREWCAGHQIKCGITKHDDGHIISMPVLSIGNIIDMVTIVQPLTEGSMTIKHANRDGKTLVWIGSKELLNDDQLKYPTSKMIRKQSSFRSSFGPSTSFGGITKSTKKKKKISEEFKISGLHQLHTVMDVEAGRLYINDQVVIDNHADLLAQIANWFAKNDPENLKKAIDDLGNTIKDGAKFVG